METECEREVLTAFRDVTMTHSSFYYRENIRAVVMSMNKRWNEWNFQRGQGGLVDTRMYLCILDTDF